MSYQRKQFDRTKTKKVHNKMTRNVNEDELYDKLVSDIKNISTQYLDQLIDYNFSDTDYK
jgi:hypothetical protein